MRIDRELRDPWAIIVGGLAGGLGWAIGIPALAAAAIGAAVWGTKAVTAAFTDRGGSGGLEAVTPGRPPMVSIKSGSPEAAWVRRAEQATGSFRKLAADAPSGPVSDRAEYMGGQAATTLAGVERLATQASAVTAAMDRVDPKRLASEEERLRIQRRNATTDALRIEIDRSLTSLADQRGVRRRLEEARDTVLARLEATVIGLESLVARLVEVLALVEAAPPLEGASKIDGLTEELDGLRKGLAETEALSRSVLSQVGDSGSVDQAVRAGPRPRRRTERDAEAP
jgi:hypothetical protein